MYSNYYGAFDCANNTRCDLSNNRIDKVVTGLVITASRKQRQTPCGQSACLVDHGIKLANYIGISSLISIAN